jgi:diguanylate cyclase (GGDEF)-like protein/PAS domain S-box-containing protein
LIVAAKAKAGFGAGFAVLLGIGVAAVAQTLAWEESSRQINHTHEVIERIDQLALNSKDAEEAARRFVAIGDLGDLERCREDLRLANDREREFETLVADDPIQRKNAVVARHLINQQTAMLVAGSRSRDPVAARNEMSQALQMLDRTSLSSGIRSALVELGKREEATLRARAGWQTRTARTSPALFGAAAVFSLLLIIGAGKWMSAERGRQATVQQGRAAREEQYRQLVELAGDIIYRTDAQGRFTFCNRSSLAMLHYTEAEVFGRSYLKLIRQDKRREAERFYLRQFLRRQRSTYYEFPIIDGHGRERWVGQNVQLLMEDGNVSGFQAIARDISERRRTETELHKSRNFIERIAATTPGILYVYDLEERRNIYSNREAITVLGYKPEEIQKLDPLPNQLFHPDDSAIIRNHHEALRHAQEGEVRRVEYRARHADGHWVWLASRDTPFEWGTDGLVKRIVGIAQDITARRVAQEKLAWQANYDALTGLPNRHHFWTRLQSALRRASISHSPTALCLFDVDNFKEINDRFGHAAGDEVLEGVGNIVRAELRSPNDFAGRLGGDEFCFALPGTDDDEAARVAERIRARLGMIAFGMETGSPFTVTATFGVAESHPDIGAKELTEAADRALYRAKSAGRNRVCVDA